MTIESNDMSHQSIDEVVESGHCMGCGFCTVGLEKGMRNNVQLEFNKGHDSFIPRLVDQQHNHLFVCPGAKMDMRSLSVGKFGRLPEDPILGIYKSIKVAYSTNPGLREQSASGGVTRVIIQHLFEQGAIDVAYCAVLGSSPYAARGCLITHADQLNAVYGSIYHPVNFGSALADLAESESRFAFVGLPCQIAGLEMLKAERSDLSKFHVLSIGLFCGGINTFQGIAYYLRGFGIDWPSVQKIEYRYGAWPGRIRLASKDRKTPVEVPRIRGNTRWKILRYVIGFQGYWMLKRCRMCPDQVADFADIAVGDPHLARLRARKGEGFSLVVGRSKRGEQVLNDTIEKGLLACEPITIEEAVASQGFTIENRRHVDAYRRVGRWLGMKYPQITTYSGLDENVSFQNLVFAWVDLIKIKIPKSRFIAVFYMPWQIFEYLFLTFAPRLIVKKIVKLLKNK